MHFLVIQAVTAVTCMCI